MCHHLLAGCESSARGLREPSPSGTQLCHHRFHCHPIPTAACQPMPVPVRTHTSLAPHSLSPVPQQGPVFLEHSAQEHRQVTASRQSPIYLGTPETSWAQALGQVLSWSLGPLPLRHLNCFSGSRRWSYHRSKTRGEGSTGGVPTAFWKGPLPGSYPGMSPGRRSH